MKILMVILPDDKIQNPVVHFEGLSDKEKNQAFDLIDAELHGDTYNMLDERLTLTLIENDELKAELERYKDIVDENEECYKVLYR